MKSNPNDEGRDERAKGRAVVDGCNGFPSEGGFTTAKVDRF